MTLKAQYTDHTDFPMHPARGAMDFGICARGLFETMGVHSIYGVN